MNLFNNIPSFHKLSWLLGLLVMGLIGHSQPIIKSDTIYLKDDSYLLIQDSVIVDNATAKAVKRLWMQDTVRRHDLARALCHNWPKLMGVKGYSLFNLLGVPDGYAPVMYHYENTYTDKGVYNGCSIMVAFTQDRINYFWVYCPPE